MHWIALPWQSAEAAATSALAMPGSTAVSTICPQVCWALGYTPRVAQLDECLLLEVSATLRLWGGLSKLQVLMAASHSSACAPLAQGATALQALAMLRLLQSGQRLPACLPQGLPLHTLSAARQHVPSLARMGCNTWGGLRDLPRAGVARRFGVALLLALDQGWGDVPDALAWLALPEQFDLGIDLNWLVDAAPPLLHAAAPLMSALQSWLRARQQGVLALELVWQHALRRCNGVDLSAQHSLIVRTAQPTQDLVHLQRLLAEHLARTTLAAPASHLRLRVLQATALPHASAGLLPAAQAEQTAEPWHRLLERLTARLGAERVQTPALHADHRPECMQRWQAPPAIPAKTCAQVAAPDAPHGPNVDLLPTWLLCPPLRLVLQGHRPCHHGPLRLLAGPHRIEAGWWNETRPEGADGGRENKDDGQGGVAVRDYFVAHNDSVGLVWVFRERLGAPGPQRWFLHGLYA